MQPYQIKAGPEISDLGSTAEYVIRVFRWNPDQKRFTASYLTNQINHARILGNPFGDDNSCEKGQYRNVSKQAFLNYLFDPEVVSEIDTGTLNIPWWYLACRAVTASPGGPFRSENNLFWRNEIINHSQIQMAEQGRLAASEV